MSSQVGQEANRLDVAARHMCLRSQTLKVDDSQWKSLRANGYVMKGRATQRT